MWYTVSVFILGIKPDYNGLLIDPCLPTTAKEYKVRRKFRDAVYNIHVVNPNGKEKGVKRIVVDGQPVEGTVVPYTAGEHTVEVEL